MSRADHQFLGLEHAFESEDSGRVFLQLAVDESGFFFSKHRQQRHRYIIACSHRIARIAGSTDSDVIIRVMQIKDARR